MEISAAFITVAILMLVLIGLAVVIIHSVSVSAGIRIRSDMLRMLNSYDRLLEKKSDEITALQARADALRARINEDAHTKPASGEAEKSAAAGVASVPAAAGYRASAFTNSYSTIRNFFRISEADKSRIVQLAREDAEKSGACRGKAAGELKEKIGFDLVFRMSQLPAEAQLELLNTSLEGADLELLESYRESNETFDITKFYDWLSSVAMLESSEVELLDGSRGTAVDADGNAVICEGIQVFAGSKLYDFSIGEREIG